MSSIPQAHPNGHAVMGVNHIPLHRKSLVCHASRPAAIQDYPSGLRERFSATGSSGSAASVKDSPRYARFSLFPHVSLAKSCCVCHASVSHLTNASDRKRPRPDPESQTPHLGAVILVRWATDGPYTKVFARVLWHVRSLHAATDPDNSLMPWATGLV
jgi:hypothetical protein